MIDAKQVQTQELATRFGDFNQELMAFVANCSEADWRAITPQEGWPVGVTARHIGVGHYPLIAWVRMVVDGQPLPNVTMDEINAMNDQHAVDHAACTKAEVMEILRTNAAAAQEYLATLSDEDLAHAGYLALFDANLTASDLFTALLLDIAQGHFTSMQAAVAE